MNGGECIMKINTKKLMQWGILITTSVIAGIVGQIMTEDEVKKKVDEQIHQTLLETTDRES